jgi:hypothetical protein
MKFIVHHPRLSAVGFLICACVMLYPGFAYLADKDKPIDRNTKMRIEAHCADAVDHTQDIDKQEHLYVACINSTWRLVQRLLTSRKYSRQWEPKNSEDGSKVSRYW